MYLQNHCLEGPPKELVRNLTDFDAAMARLKDRYAKVSVIKDYVLKDISELKMNTNDESTEVCSNFSVMPGKSVGRHDVDRLS